MKIIFRHLLREFLVNLFYCIAAFLMIFVMYDVFDHIAKLLDASPPWEQVLLYYVSLVATSIEYLAPASLLLATLYTLWQLTRANEITAMRANGISLPRIVLPFLLVGLAFALLTTAIHEVMTPRTGFWALSLSRNDFNPVDKITFHHQAYYNHSNHRLWIINEFDYAEPHILYGVKVTEEREDHTRIRDIYAQHAEHLDGTWWFYGVQEQAYTREDYPSSSLVPAVPDPSEVREMPYLTTTPTEFALNVRPWEFYSVRDMFYYMQTVPDISEEATAQHWFDIHSRIARPWACLVVIVFGIPCGIRGGRQNALIGIFMAITLFFAFYATIQVSIFLGKRDILVPWLSAWLPNLLFASAGTTMIWRMK